MALWKKKEDFIELPLPEIALERDGDQVRIIVDGQGVQEIPGQVYESMRQKLAGEPERARNGFLLEIGAEEESEHILLRLPPLDEIGPTPLQLQTDDGRRYGRQYRMQIILSDKHKIAVISDAQTGAEVERLPWDAFAKRATADLWRSRTSYRQMLGEHDPERHLTLLARRYRPAPKQSDETQPPSRKRKKTPAELEAEPHEPTAPVADGRQWLNRHPAVAVGLCAVGIIIIFIGLCHALAEEPPVYRSGTAGIAQLEETVSGRISKYEALAKRFELIAVDDRAAAADIVYEIRYFIQNAHKLSLTEAQAKSVKELETAIPRLQKIIENTAGP